MSNRYFATHDAVGKILTTGSYIDGLVDDPLSHLGDNVVISDTPIAMDQHYVVDGEIVAYPDKPSDAHEWDWTTYEWGLNIELARTAKALEIDRECKTAILSGFASSALGVEHHYPAKATDQQNLASSVLASLLPIPADWTTPFWCADVNGVWAFRLHDAAQIQQVGVDAKSAILAAMGKNEGLQGQIAAAVALIELEEIVW